jgi:transcriptional regulator with XRE-family HTH domain
VSTVSHGTIHAEAGAITNPGERAGASEGQGGGSTVRRIQLGSRLRALRLAKGLSREEAGHPIRASESKISRMELGRVGFKERDVSDLLTLYGVEDIDERDRMFTLLREANAPSWWQAFGDVEAWFQSYLDMERAAELIRAYEVQFVPGLLQTEAYARAVISIGHGRGASEEVERRVRLRLARTELLRQPGAPRMWAVLDEAVLRRAIGGRAVLREQIESLIEAARMPNVQIQVLPFEAGGHAGAGGAFSILRFPYRELSDVVFLEHLTSGIYLDRPEDVDQYAEAIGRLFIEAAPLSSTDEILHRLRDELT